MVETWKLAVNLERALQNNPERTAKARKVLMAAQSPSPANNGTEISAENLFTAALVNGDADIVRQGKQLLQETYKQTRQIGDHEADQLVRAHETGQREFIASVLGKGM